MGIAQVRLLMYPAARMKARSDEGSLPVVMMPMIDLMAQWRQRVPKVPSKARSERGPDFGVPVGQVVISGVLCRLAHSFFHVPAILK